MIYFISNQTQIPIEGEVPIQMATIQDCLDYLKDKIVVAIDTETEGLNFLTKNIIMFQIGDPINQFVIDTRYISIEPLRGILEDRNILKVLQNVKFDYKFIKRQYNITLENVYDTMLVDQIIHCGKEYMDYSLESLSLVYLGKQLNKTIRNKFVNLQGAPYTSTQIVYGAEDIEVLILIANKQKEKLKELPVDLSLVVQLENDASLAFADIEFNGFEFDKDKWLEASKENKLELNSIKLILDNFVTNEPKLSKFVNKNIQLDAFTPVEELRRCIIKWSSPTQVLKVMQEYGFSKLETVNHNDLKTYKKNEFVKIYLQYKEIEKAVSTYGESFLHYIGVDGKIRTSFYQILETGRVSSGSKQSNLPNLQNIPRSNKYRNAFHARDGYTLVTCDFSGQELKIIASGSKDPVWKECIDNKQDLHSVCAELVFGQVWKNAAEDGCAFYTKNKSQCFCNEHKKLRTQVKSINFALAYGAGPFKLSEQLEISVKEAEALINKYFRVFPSIKVFLERLAAFGVANGYILTYKPFRRLRWFPQWHQGLTLSEQFMSLEDKKLKGSIERMSKNTPIQGSGADMVKLSLIKIRRYINDNKLPYYLVSQVHDKQNCCV